MKWILSALGLFIAVPAVAKDPIIDMHVHALPITAEDVGTAMCVPVQRFLPPPEAGRDRGEQFVEFLRDSPCPDPKPAPPNEEALIAETVARLEAANAIAVLQGPPERVRAWMAAAPGRFIPSLQLQIGRDPYDAAAAREFFERGGFVMLGEVSNQYVGIGPDDPRMEPFWAMAEELDIPVGLHMGSGMPGAGAIMPTFRVAAGNPLLLEEVLARHPKLRISIQHMAEGFHEQLKLMLYTYPQLYVEISAPNWWAGDAFHDDLDDLVKAGFGKRILYGSDSIVFPGILDYTREQIEQAEYLSDAQKRDILFNNAVRFLRLDEADVRSRASRTRG